MEENKEDSILTTDFKERVTQKCLIMRAAIASDVVKRESNLATLQINEEGVQVSTRPHTKTALSKALAAAKVEHNEETFGKGTKE